MIKDILYKTDILNGLFTQKDFDFLKGTNDRQEEIEFQIKMADIKREKIIECIKEIDIEEEQIKNFDIDQLKKYIDSAEHAFESINKVIKNLTSLLDEFNEIEKNILELVVKKESSTITDTKKIVKRINEQITNFKLRQKEINEENSKYKNEIDSFLNTIEINKSIKTENIVESINVKNNYKKLYDTKDVEVKDNLVLKISENEKKVYLPYTKLEIQEFLNNYPDEYKTSREVIEQEFISDIAFYNKHPVFARFREAYSLSRNREMKSAIDSLKFAMDLMFKRDINPTIIAAVKSQQQLEHYIECLENNELDSFKYFKIIYEVNPI